MIRSFTLTALLASGLTAPIPLVAHDGETHYDRINLSADAGREIDTDTLVAVLYKQHQSSDQASASDEVNRSIRWAIDRAKAAKVKVTTSSYNTQPIYQKQNITGWRVRQSIRVESGDAKLLANLLGELQKELSIQTLQNELSIDARKQAEEGLIADALRAFQDRAAAVAKTLGRSGHKIVNININTSGDRPPRPMMRSAMAIESAAKVAAPAIESDSLRVQVQVNGTIELIAP